MMTTGRQAPSAVKIHPSDNVAVAVRPLERGDSVTVDDISVMVAESIAPGHKIALGPFEPGEPVVKYGFPIGEITVPVAGGAWVHSHNLRTRLDGVTDFAYHPLRRREEAPSAVPAFSGYRRADGRVGTRNEVWVLNTVGCVNFAAEGIARISSDRFRGTVDGVHAFGHPFGCSQLGDDLRNTQRILAGLMRNPNAGGILVLGLGCENNQMESLLALAGGIDRSRLRFFNSQDVVDERDEGLAAIAELVARMEGDRREDCRASDLVLGHKCGGSDGFSGITANALVGRIADRLTSLGGTVLLTEVPEMFGAEQALIDRAATEEVHRGIVSMIDEFKQYFADHDQPIYENPSPGNKAGGLTTLEEKSLGAIQKGGQATITDVLRYGQPLRAKGLSLLEAPGNDGVSSTAMVASGATMLLFTTGRGTPLGFPVPTVKISSNTAIAQKKPHWIDFNAGALLDGMATMEQLEGDLFTLILDIASGRKRANNEEQGYREIAIWKGGVTL